MSFVSGAASIGAQVDLVANSESMARGLNRFYSDTILKTLKEKVLEKAQRFPEMSDAGTIRRCRTLYEFDSIYIAPMHGFSSAMDYWRRYSAKVKVLKKVAYPLLFLMQKESFMPAWSHPTLDDVSSSVYMEQTEEGGYIGFPAFEKRETLLMVSTNKNFLVLR